MTKASRDRVGSPDSFVVSPKSLGEKNLIHLSASLHRDSFVSRDKSTWAAGRRAGALFFALHRAISSWHETSLPSIWTCYRLTVSPWPLASLLSTGTGKKQVTATQTAPNQKSRAVMPIWDNIKLLKDYKKETLLSERQAKDAIFSDVLVAQRYANNNDFCKYFAKKRTG